MADGDTTATTTTTGDPPATTTSVPVVPKPENMVPQHVLDRATAEKWNEKRAREEAERKLALTEATLEEMRKIASGDGGGGDTSKTTTTTTTAKPAERMSPEELQRLVNEQSAVQQFNEKCNAAVEAGRTAHDDFNKVVLQDLTKLSPIYDPRAGGPIIPQPLVEAALETGEAHEVLYALGKDPANAERIMRLSPIKQAVEIAKFHDKLVASRPKPEEEVDKGEETETTSETTTNAEPLPNTSRAPAPIRSRTGAGSGTRPPLDIMKPESSSMAEWYAARQADIARKRSNGSARR
jgi:hypothetical protein